MREDFVGAVGLNKIARFRLDPRDDARRRGLLRARRQRRRRVRLHVAAGLPRRVPQAAAAADADRVPAPQDGRGSLEVALCRGGAPPRIARSLAWIKEPRRDTTQNRCKRLSTLFRDVSGRIHAMMPRTVTGLLAATALLGGSLTHAADYPSKPITIIVPFAAGGPTDTVARLLGQAMGADLKQTVIVENVGRRRRHRRRGARRPRGSGRLHALPAPHRPVHGARALPQAAVRRGQRLRAHRPRDRRADDPRRARQLPAEGPEGAGRLRQGRTRTR